MLSSYHFRSIILTAISILITDISDVISIRVVCYQNEQPHCNQPFIKKYKNLSRDTLNVIDADTYFWLFTNNNPDEPEWLDKCGGSLPPISNFNPENEFIVMISPWIVGICDTVGFRELKDQILQKGKYNVILVDWSWGNKFPYRIAIENAKIVGHQLVVVLSNIQRQTGITSDKITLVGISLGAQIAGFVGRDFHVARITGLDPAGPDFGPNLPLSERLDRTDADFVDVWHCNAGNGRPYLGINYDAGDVDFWINGGTKQVSCVTTIVPSVLKGDFLYALANVQRNSCSHIHCNQYYKVSINPGRCQFVGVHCDNYEEFKSGSCRSCGKNGKYCQIMGFDTFNTLKNTTFYPGRYYVETSFKYPYCDNSYIHLKGFQNTYRSSLQV